MLTRGAPPNLQIFNLVLNQGTALLKNFEYDTPEIVELETTLLRLEHLKSVILCPVYTPDDCGTLDPDDIHPEALTDDEDEGTDISNLGETGVMDWEFILCVFASLLAEGKAVIETEGCSEDTFKLLAGDEKEWEGMDIPEEVVEEIPRLKEVIEWRKSERGKSG